MNLRDLLMANDTAVTGVSRHDGGGHVAGDAVGIAQDASGGAGAVDGVGSKATKLPWLLTFQRV